MRSTCTYVLMNLHCCNEFVFIFSSVCACGPIQRASEAEEKGDHYSEDPKD